jgi:NtrC-family two-component system sensor histidine kinase KinB
MFGLRHKLSLGFIGLLLIMIIIGLKSVQQIGELGQGIGVILKENYRSVVACQEMKKALERIDSGVLTTLLGYEREGNKEITDGIAIFSKALDIEKNNVTLPGEGERVGDLESLSNRYMETLKAVRNPTISESKRRDTYFRELSPLFKATVASLDGIIQLNQENMIYEKTLAQKKAGEARRQMYFYLFAGAIIACLWMFFTQRWILGPINQLIAVTDDIRRGNLDLVVQSDSSDEIGRLSNAFNTMTASLRELRQTDRAKLLRIQRSAHEAFNNLSEAIAVVNLQGTVELSSPAAQDVFGLRPDVTMRDLPFPWMTGLFEEVVRKGRRAEPREDQAVVGHFVKNEQRYYHPQAIPILTLDKEITGVVMVIEDVTGVRGDDKVKWGMISALSDRLETPLTSLRLAIHLLLTEKVATLTPKQEELLIAARDDGERLHAIIEELLNIGRIRSGKVIVEYRAVSVRDMIMASVDEFRAASRDEGISLRTELPDDLPDVSADPSQIHHVLGNLLSNAVKFTSLGGSITVSARSDEDLVSITVSDTGVGVPPEYQDRIFEQFFAGGDNQEKSGAGLGLYIAKEIIEAHGGTIEVKSKPGQGSAFTFSLRRAGTANQEASYD